MASYFPPFPDDLPTHPLLVIDYNLLARQDITEMDRLWDAATKLGFWYLKNHGSNDEVEAMFRMAQDTMELPLEEKLKFEQGDDGNSFGYKKAFANAVDASGQNLDTAEFLNISKDDALAFPEVARRQYPDTVNRLMQSNVRPFIQKSLDINETILAIFNTKLGLPASSLQRQHKVHEWSPSEARITRNPPHMAANRVALPPHTDFGSLSVLYNQGIGGLQVLPPGAEEWQFVKPIMGHAICNIGDALSLFSGGILRSNMHRVVTPPGKQADIVRWSFVYFTRPGNSVLLRALVDESDIIKDAVAKAEPGKNFETGSTAEEWFTRRIKGMRIKNRKGPETWMASRGTELDPAKA